MKSLARCQHSGFGCGDERGGEIADGLCGVGGVQFDLFDDGGADDDSVCGAGDHGGLLRGRDAEADTNGDVRVGLDRCDEGGNVGRGRFGPRTWVTS